MKIYVYLFLLFLSRQLPTLAQENNKTHDIVEKSMCLYKNVMNSRFEYYFYQKYKHQMDTTLHAITLKHHASNGKIYYTKENITKKQDSEVPNQILLEKNKAKNLQVLLRKEHSLQDGYLHGTVSIKHSILQRDYQHLPVINPKYFFSSIEKTYKGLKETDLHYIITSIYYDVFINKTTYQIEEIVYNNQKKDFENIYERIVIKNQQYNLPELGDLNTYKIKLPKKYNEQNTKNSLLNDTLAPTWEYLDVVSDKIHKLADLQGKVVVLDFWNTVCAPCIKFLPAMKELQAEFAGKDVVFIGMASDKSKENIVKHLEKYAGGVFYTNVICTEKEYKAYKIYAMPAFFVIDKTGKIVYSKEGTKGTQEELRKSIQEALDK